VLNEKQQYKMGIPAQEHSQMVLQVKAVVLDTHYIVHIVVVVGHSCYTKIAQSVTMISS
jgi:hypothetical protein